MNQDEIWQKIAQYKFYHSIQLTDQIKTPGNPNYLSTQNLVIDEIRKTDLKNKRVLDIGCRDGLFSFEAEKLGSSEVIGIDNDISKPAVEFLIPFFKSSIQMFEMNIFDLRPDTFGKFDVIVFAGVLYHLRYPVWALKLIRDVLNDNGKLILETAVWRGNRNHAMLYCPVEESPYHDPTSCTFFNEKGLRVTLQSLGFEAEKPRYLLRQGSIRSTLRYAKWTLENLTNRARGLHTKVNIDRGLFACRLSRAVLDKSLAQYLTQYWDGTHDFHTRKGG